jgi:apolipoprotein N-acyltransferase
MAVVDKKSGPGLIEILKDMALVVSGALLFSLSFPNFLHSGGFFFLAWVSLVPLFLLIRRAGFVRVMIYGPVYGFLTYALHNYWLLGFNPTAFLIVPTIYAGWFFLLFPCLKLADLAFPKGGWLIQILLFLAYETLRTKGFLAYSYGILGYSQYPLWPLIGIADLGGVLPVSALVILPSAYIPVLLRERKNPRFRRKLVPVAVWLAAVLVSVVYGLAAKVDYSASPMWRPALVQHNVNAWLSGIPVYRKSFSVLKKLSNEALENKPDIIIWSETAFVPAVEWHYRYRQEREKFELVSELLDYLQDNSGTPFLIGNNDAIKTEGRRTDYNAALLFRGNRITGRYHKIHLVPFTEHFPYGRWLPGLERKILETGATFYGKGREYRVFENGPVRFSPMICYEDTFGYLSRNFVNAGADVLVNLTNDAWSPEAACCYQHALMARFRSVENRRSMVRSTTGGLTCVIDPNGRILASLEPFSEGVLLAGVPVYTGRKTLYTRWGDWPEYLIIPSSLVMMALSVIRLMKRRKENRHD